MTTVTVSGKGWVVIPKLLRQKYGLKKGAQVQVIDYGDGLALLPMPADPAQALQGILPGGPSLTGQLLAERAHERAQEENRHE